MHMFTKYTQSETFKLRTPAHVFSILHAPIEHLASAKEMYSTAVSRKVKCEHELYQTYFYCCACALGILREGRVD